MTSPESWFEPALNSSHPRILADVAQAHALARVIRGIPIPPSVQQRLDRLNILRAVRGTTGIEGTELSAEEIDLVVESPPGDAPLGPGREREEQEVRNAEALMRYVGEYLEHSPSAPVTEELILEFHRILTQDINYPHNEPGRYRHHSVVVGRYRPPPTGEEVRRLMTEFVRWFNTGLPTHWDPVLRAIAAHFYVGSIHPFGDGNGRTSRAVESFLLYKSGVNVRGYYSLSNYYYQNRPEYIANLDGAREQDIFNLTPFVSFALRGLVQELEQVHAEVLAEVRVIAFRDYARESLDHSGRLGTPAGQRQLNFLISLSNGPVSLRELRSGRHPLAYLYRRLTTRTLTRDINTLKQENLIVADGDELRANLDLMSRFTV